MAEGTEVFSIHGTLTLNDAGYKEKLAEDAAATKQHGQSMDESAGKSGKFGAAMAATGVAIAAAGAIITKGVMDAVKSTEDYGMSVMKISRMTGMSTAESSKMAFAFHEVGIDSEQGAKMIRFFDKAISEAADSTTHNSAELTKLGVSVKDAQGHIKPFSQVLEETADKVNNLGSQEEKVAEVGKLFGARNGTDMLKLLQLGSQGIQQLMEDAQKYGLVLSGSNVAAVQKFIMAHREFDAAMQGVKISIGMAVMPAISSLIHTITELVANFQKLSPQTKELIGHFLGFAGPILLVVGGVIALAGGIGMLTAAVAPLGIGLGALFGWATVIIAVIIGLGVAINAVVTHTIGWKKVFEELHKVAAPVMQAIGKIVHEVIGGVVSTFKAIAEAVKPLLPILGQALMQAFHASAQAAKTIWDALKQLWNAIQPLMPVLKTIAVIIGVAIVVAVIAWIKVWTIAIKIIADVISVVIKVAAFLINVLVGAFKAVSSAVTAVGNVIHAIWNGIKTFLFIIVVTIVALFMIYWNLIGKHIAKVMGDIWNSIVSIWNSVSGFIGGILGAIWGFISGVWNAISGFISGVMNTIFGIISGVWNSISGVISSVAHFIYENIIRPFNDAVNFVKGIVGQFADVGKNIIDAIAKAITGAAGSVKDAIVKAVGDPVKIAKDILGIHSPSTVFMAMGQAMMEGMAIGIGTSAPLVTQALNASLPTLAVQASASVTGGVPTTASTNQPSGINVIQHFNPKQLSRSDIEMAASEARFTVGMRLKSGMA